MGMTFWTKTTWPSHHFHWFITAKIMNGCKCDSEIPFKYVNYAQHTLTWGQRNRTKQSTIKYNRFCLDEKKNISLCQSDLLLLVWIYHSHYGIFSRQRRLVFVSLLLFLLYFFYFFAFSNFFFFLVVHNFFPSFSIFCPSAWCISSFLQPETFHSPMNRISIYYWKLKIENWA